MRLSSQSIHLLVKASPESCSLLRRLGVMLYDALLLTGILLFAILLFLAITGQLGNMEEGVPMEVRNPGIRLGMQLYILTIAVGFYAGFWHKTGRTLGLQTWKLRVETMDGDRLSWSASILRFFVGVLSLLSGGLGFLWMYTNADRRTWHDLATNSRIVKTATRL